MTGVALRAVVESRRLDLEFEIAAELVLSPRTVERHIANIYSKTDTHSRAQLAAFAVRHGIG